MLFLLELWAIVILRLVWGCIFVKIKSLRSWFPIQILCKIIFARTPYLLNLESIYICCCVCVCSIIYLYAFFADCCDVFLVCKVVNWWSSYAVHFWSIVSNKSEIYHNRDFLFSWCHLFLFKNMFRCISFKSSFIHNDFLKRVYNVCGDENELSKSVKQITLKKKKKNARSMAVRKEL